MTDKELAKKDKRYREGFLKKLVNYGGIFLLLLISRLPFRIIYIISDGLYFLMSKVIRYRKKVIFENLMHAFPEKPEEQIKDIADKFYRHLTDLILEAVKMHRMSAKEMDERVKFKDMDKFHPLYEQKKSIIVLGMHHNNWEWASAVQRYAQHKLLMLYNPVRGNRALEKFIIDSREKWGGLCVPVHKSARTVLEFNRAGKPTAIWLGADQTPPSTSKFWTIFLNREAPFFSGPEKIASRTKQPIYFHRTKKTGRGKYEVTLEPLIAEPDKIEPDEILLKYVRKMEEIIREEPEYYLWSHRRWKHTRPEGIPLTL